MSAVSAVGSFLKALFVKAKTEAETVAPEVQAQIDAILKSASSQVAGLKQSSSVASMRKQMEDDVSAVNQTAAHHVSLIKQVFEQNLAKANAVLPSVSAMFGTPTGATGATGASGPTGPTS